MKNLGLGRYALCSCVAAALLAGCGGSQPPIGASGAMPQTSAIATHTTHGKSWMLPEARGRNLLYVSSGSSVYVYTYPRAKMVGVLADFEATRGECVDKAGDVFIIDHYAGVDEYAHGGTSPIAMLDPPWSFNLGCSVDPTTGNLAVTGGGDAVTIFPYNRTRGWRYPRE
jgi:hypothetical protein